MKYSCSVNSLIAGLMMILTPTSAATIFPRSTEHGILESYEDNCSQPVVHPSIRNLNKTHLQAIIENHNNSLRLNQTEKQRTVNSTMDETNVKCHEDQTQAICHSYIHNMYHFYSTVSHSLFASFLLNVSWFGKWFPYIIAYIISYHSFLNRHEYASKIKRMFII